MKNNKSENKTKTAKVKPILNKENSKVLTCIVKNAGLTATEIRKKLRWAFVPTRALGFLRQNKFVLVDESKRYTVSSAGEKALASSIKPKRAKIVKAEVATETPATEIPTPVVAVEPENPTVETPVLPAVEPAAA